MSTADTGTTSCDLDPARVRSFIRVIVYAPTASLQRFEKAWRSQLTCMPYQNNLEEPRVRAGKTSAAGSDL